MALGLIFNFLYFALQIYEYVFFAYIILSWFPVDQNNPLIKFIRGLCQPLYDLVLKYLPPLRFGMMDFSVIYIFILFQIAQSIIIRLSKLVL